MRKIAILFLMIFGCVINIFSSTTQESKSVSQEQVPVPKDAISDNYEKVIHDYVNAMQKKRSPVLKLLTWNVGDIYRGKSNITKEKLLEILRQIDADVIALQGIIIEASNDENTSEVAMLSSSLGMQIFFANTIGEDRKEKGNVVILSKFQMHNSVATILKSAGTKESRSLIDTTIMVHEILPVKILSSEFDCQRPDINSESIKHSCLFINPPIGILLGDFQTRKNNKVLNDLKNSWCFVATTNNAKLAEKDYSAQIFVRPKNKWKIISCEFLKSTENEEKKALFAEIQYLPDIK